MIKKIRTIIQGSMYHTYSRIINKEALMQPHKVKYLMEEVIRMALEKYKFHLNNYTLLDDHFHFLITTIEGEANISRIMQFIKAQFARRYNKMMNRSGPVWNERFGDRIIEKAHNPEFYFFWVSNYIFYNPVKKGYVQDPRDYEFSCIRFYFDEEYVPRVKLTFSEYFLNLGKTFKERAKKFLEFEEIFVNVTFGDWSFA